LRIIFAGNNLRGKVCLEYLSKESKLEIPLVIGHPKYIKEGYFKTIHDAAKKLGYQVISPEDINSNDVNNIISNLKPDFMLLVGYSAKILKKKTYKIPKYGTLNVHASLLPNYRGAAPLNWAIINGESECGVSIIEIDDGIDTGPILAQERIKIKKTDDILSITSKINELVPLLLLDVLGDYKNKKLKCITQSIGDGFFYSKRKPEDGLINFRNEVSDCIQRKVRALLPPYPGAFFYHAGNKITILSCGDEVLSHKGIPGRVIRKDDYGLYIMCKDRGLLIKKILVNDRDILDPLKYEIKLGEDIQ
jgi:methionyl-tRNA formyltransferase